MIDQQLVLRSSVVAAAPLVSVIIPTRDRAEILADAVRAVLAQDLRDEIELIVCDNASSDRTEILMRELVANADRAFTYIKLSHDLGPAGARNVGLELARGRYIAFTDSDCAPSPRWLAEALHAFVDERIGVVQGRTVGAGGRVRLFEHHIAIDRLDGSFATANVVYRRQAIVDQRFHPGRWYWEDVDLGWRVVNSGWSAAFAERAVVVHRIMPLSPLRWILWPRRYATLPAITRRYPGFRRHLFLGLWVRPMNLLCEVALLGAFVALWRAPALVLVAPYAVAFARSRGLSGRLPPVKAAAHALRDLVAVFSLAAASVRHRSLVL